jgi:hypothetical protein
VTGACPYCAYDLEGLGDIGRCPECGNIVKAAYLESLMRHGTLRQEGALYWIALVGWALHALAFWILLMAGALLGLFGVVLSILLLCLSVVLMERSRKSWPRRFARRRESGLVIAPRGMLMAFAAWMLPAIVSCGLLASVPH